MNILDRFERYDPEKIKVREDLHSLWQTNSELVAASDLYAGKIAQLDKDLKALWQANSELVVSRDGFFSANAESLAKLQAVTQANADLVAEREAYLREKASVSEQLASSQQAIATLVGERDEALNEAKGWHGRYDDVELRLDRVAIEHNALAVALDEATADVAHKAGAIAELTGNVRALEETVAALKPLETRLELALSEGNALALARDEALADGKRKAGVITGLQRRLHTLEETVAALELKLERALIESNVLARAYDEAVADAKRKAGVLAGLQERASALEETVAGLKPLESKLEHALSHGNALALARDEARADATRKAGMIVEFEGQVRALQEAIAALKPVAARYDRLANELRAEDAPRSIRLVLPIARALRAGTRMFGRRPKVATPVQAVVPVDQGHAVAVAAPAAPPKQSWTKRFALFLYTRLGRVFIRPLAWRARTFLLAPLRPHLDDSRRAMTEQLDAIGRNLEGVRLTLEPLRPVSGQLDSVSQEFWARLHAVSQDLAALHRALEPLRPTGEKLDAIAANLEAVRVAELAVQHQLASFTGRGHELSPEFIKSIEALLLTIAVRSPRD